MNCGCSQGAARGLDTDVGECLGTEGSGTGGVLRGGIDGYFWKGILEVLTSDRLDILLEIGGQTGGEAKDEVCGDANEILA